VRVRFEAVEIPLKRTKKSQAARNRSLVSLFSMEKLLTGKSVLQATGDQRLTFPFFPAF